MINFELFSEKSKILINDSQNKAIENNHQQVTPEHLVITLFDQNDEYIQNILNDLTSIYQNKKRSRRYNSIFSYNFR